MLFVQPSTTANDALHAVVKAQQLLHHEAWMFAPIKVRMGIHTGKAEFQENGEYQGYLTLRERFLIHHKGHKEHKGLILEGKNS